MAYGQNMFRDSIKAFEENTRSGIIEMYDLSELSDYEKNMMCRQCTRRSKKMCSHHAKVIKDLDRCVCKCWSNI